MTYINGATDSAPANVHMVESDTFGNDLLHIAALKDIRKGEELIMDYGNLFQLPTHVSNNHLVQNSKGKKAKIKTVGRAEPPPIPRAPAQPPKARGIKRKKKDLVEAGGKRNT
jgi:hypothetical protein